MNPVKLLIVDDHEFFTRSIIALLRMESAIEIIGTASTGEQAVALCQNLHPTVVLMDLNIPHLSGLVAMQQMCTQDEAPYILVLTGMDDAQSVLRAFDAGAQGFLRKDTLTDELLISAIFTVAGGGFLVDARTFAQLKHSVLARQPR